MISTTPTTADPYPYLCEQDKQFVRDTIAAFRRYDEMALLGGAYFLYGYLIRHYITGTLKKHLLEHGARVDYLHTVRPDSCAPPYIERSPLDTPHDDPPEQTHSPHISRRLPVHFHTGPQDLYGLAQTHQSSIDDKSQP